MSILKEICLYTLEILEFASPQIFLLFDNVHAKIRHCQLGTSLATFYMGGIRVWKSQDNFEESVLAFHLYMHCERSNSGKQAG